MISRVGFSKGAPIAFAALAACGGAPAKPAATSEPTDSGPHAVAPSEPPPKPRVPEAYEPSPSPSDVISPFVRAEHSSRLALPLPQGKARERWKLALDGKLDPAFILATGTRIVVEGRPTSSATGKQTPFVIADTQGLRVASDLAPGEQLRIDPNEGKIFGIGGTEAPSAWKLADGSFSADKLSADDPRSVTGPLAVRASSHDGTYVFITRTNVEIDVRASTQQRSVVEPPVVPLDASIDDDGNLDVIVRQDRDLALWTTPLSGGSVGRIRFGHGDVLKRERANVPPILGKNIRVVVLDDRMLAFARDGKVAWERKGALTGGASITSDDRLLVASDAKLIAIDSTGHASEIVTAPKEIFLTPPILTTSGLLLVASGATLHAYAFE